MSLNKLCDNTFKSWMKIHANEVICPQGIKQDSNQQHTFTPPSLQNNTHDGYFLSYNHTTQKTEWKPASGGVSSVNSKSGVVVLNHTDLTDISTNKTHTQIDSELKTLTDKTNLLNTSSQLASNLIPSTNLSYTIGNPTNKILSTYSRDIICDKIQGTTAGPSDLELVNQNGKGITILDGMDGSIQFTSDKYSGSGPNSKAGKYIRIADSNGTLEPVSLVTGTGDVVGPSISSDSAIVRFDGVTGKLIKNSTVGINDNGFIQGVQNMNLLSNATIYGSLLNINGFRFQGNSQLTPEGEVELLNVSGKGVSVRSDGNLNLTGANYQNKQGRLLVFNNNSGKVDALSLNQGFLTIDSLGVVSSTNVGSTQTIIRYAKANGIIPSGNNDQYQHGWATTTGNINGSILSNPEIYLPTGEYYVQAVATAHETGVTKFLLILEGQVVNDTEGIVTTANINEGVKRLHGSWRISITAPQNSLELRQYTQFGTVSGISGPSNPLFLTWGYAQLTITKL